MIKVIVKETGKPCEVKEIENTLEELQRIVGGYIETVPFLYDALLIVNEEGKIQRLKPNFSFNGDMIVGSAIIVGQAGEEFDSLTVTQSNYVEQFFHVRFMKEKAADWATNSKT